MRRNRTNHTKTDRQTDSQKHIFASRNSSELGNWRKQNDFQTPAYRYVRAGDFIHQLSPDLLLYKETANNTRNNTAIVYVRRHSTYDQVIVLWKGNLTPARRRKTQIQLQYDIQSTMLYVLYQHSKGPEQIVWLTTTIQMPMWTCR